VDKGVNGTVASSSTQHRDLPDLDYLNSNFNPSVRQQLDNMVNQLQYDNWYNAFVKWVEVNRVE